MSRTTVPERLRTLLHQRPRSAADRAGAVDRLDLPGIFRTTAVETDWQAAEYDLMFLDGDHRPKTVLGEISAAPGQQPLWPGGKVIVGPERAVERLRRAGWPIEARPLGELPWPTKLGTSRTSLAILGRSTVGQAGGQASHLAGREQRRGEERVASAGDVFMARIRHGGSRS